MNKQEKEVFVMELINNVKDDVLKDVDKLPEDWDGIELRWLIKEHFEQIVFHGYRDKRKKRYQDYWNYIICYGLG